MNARDLYLNILNFEHTGRCLNWEFGYWGGTLKRWYREGLPKKYGLIREVAEGETVCGPGLHHPIISSAAGGGKAKAVLKDNDVSDFFNFDEGLFTPPINHWIYPFFDMVVLEEYEDKKKIIDTDGITKIVKKDSDSIPQSLEWPVKDEKSWQKLKEERFIFNYDLRTDNSYGDFSNRMKEKKQPFHLFGGPVGFYGSIRSLVGEMNLLYMYYDNPKLIKNILSFLTDFWINIAEEILSRYEIKVAAFWEDMSGKNGPLISPRLFKEFMTPFYRRLTGFLKTKGVEHFIVDTDGNVEELIPLFMEAGITGMYPFERQAGNELLEIRKKYPKLQMMGGFNKNLLAKNLNEIDQELKIIEKMLKLGGYIPTCDHLVPPDVPWENYVYFRRKLNNILKSGF